MEVLTRLKKLFSSSICKTDPTLCELCESEPVVPSCVLLCPEFPELPICNN
jgi:hypothetical protein